MERATPAGKPCRALKVRTSTENWGGLRPPPFRAPDAEKVATPRPSLALRGYMSWDAQKPPMSLCCLG